MTNDELRALCGRAKADVEEYTLCTLANHCLRLLDELHRMTLMKDEWVATCGRLNQQLAAERAKVAEMNRVLNLALSRQCSEPCTFEIPLGVAAVQLTRIPDLEAKVERLRAALQPFAAYSYLCGPHVPDDNSVGPNIACAAPRVYHCRHAAAALEETKS